MLLGNLPQKPKDTVENLLAARFQKIPIMSYEMIFVFVEMITAVFKWFHFFFSVFSPNFSFIARSSCSYFTAIKQLNNNKMILEIFWVVD